MSETTNVTEVTNTQDTIIVIDGSGETFDTAKDTGCYSKCYEMPVDETLEKGVKENG